MKKKYTYISILFFFIIRKLIKIIKICAPKASVTRRRKISAVISKAVEHEINTIKSRILYYVPDAKDNYIIYHTNVSFFSILLGESVLIFKKLNKFEEFVCYQFENVFFVDQKNYIGAWDWIKLSNYYYNHKVDIDEAKGHLLKAVCNRKFNDQSVYVFGTGPSLDRALEFYHRDGDCIVCNTIVKDRELFIKLNPVFIVAGDALYHYSYTDFARTFRNDLKLRLRETDTYFVYPIMFDVLVRREFSDLNERLIPIPIGSHKDIYVNLLERFELPNLGNVLPLLQLPLACTMSSKILLCGFDGRSPDDGVSPFWRNSNKHSYPELMHTLQSEFPFFFDFFVPDNKSKNYINSVHGNELETKLAVAEERNFSFEMLHPSWTTIFAKRYKGSTSTAVYYEIKEKKHD